MDTRETSAWNVTDAVIDILERQNDPSNNIMYPTSRRLLDGDMVTGAISASNVTTSENKKDPSNNIKYPTSRRLLDERCEKNHQLCLDLFNAALEGDANRAKSLIGKDHKLLEEAITEGQDTVLHVAAGAKKTVFVQDMINFMEEKDFWTLKLQNEKGNTAFCLAAMAGSMPIAKAMWKRDQSLLTIRGKANMTPLYLAALYGQKDMAHFLYKKMNNELLKAELIKDKMSIFFISIDTTLYDLALKLLQDHDHDNELTMRLYEIHGNGKTQTPLHRLAQTPLHLLDQTSKSDETTLLDQALQLIECLWKKILEKEGPEVLKYFTEDDKDLLFDAAHLGNFRFLEKLILLYPDLVLQRDKDQRTIFHIAIMHRHDNLFNLIHKIGFNKQVIAAYTDKDDNTLLHLAATYPKPSPVSKVPGAALEMQRELQIFKEVELLLMPSLRELRNREGKTPRELFTCTHANLVENGEKWMRDTASQCMLVGTIIATVIFSAAFSWPGGTNETEGIPVHRRNITFRMFSMADEIALSFSCISILTFLSVLTSRYAEIDFYISLPLKLVSGLLSLSISIATMLLAFISSFFIAYGHHRSNAIPVLGTLFIVLPVFVFVWAQYSLLRDILRSSFRFWFSSSQ